MNYMDQDYSRLKEAVENVVQSSNSPSDEDYRIVIAALIKRCSMMMLHLDTIEDLLRSLKDSLVESKNKRKH